jgi:hypothetical protein
MLHGCKQRVRGEHFIVGTAGGGVEMDDREFIAQMRSSAL